MARRRGNNILTFEQRYERLHETHAFQDFSQHGRDRAAADGFIAGQLGAMRITKSPQADDPEGPRHFGNLWFANRD